MWVYSRPTRPRTVPDSPRLRFRRRGVRLRRPALRFEWTSTPRPSGGITPVDRSPHRRARGPRRGVARAALIAGAPCSRLNPSTIRALSSAVIAFSCWGVSPSISTPAINHPPGLAPVPVPPLPHKSPAVRATLPRVALGGVPRSAGPAYARPRVGRPSALGAAHRAFP